MLSEIKVYEIFLMEKYSSLNNLLEYDSWSERILENTGVFLMMWAFLAIEGKFIRRIFFLTNLDRHCIIYEVVIDRWVSLMALPAFSQRDLQRDPK